MPYTLNIVLTFSNDKQHILLHSQIAYLGRSYEFDHTTLFIIDLLRKRKSPFPCELNIFNQILFFFIFFL